MPEKEATSMNKNHIAMAVTVNVPSGLLAVFSAKFGPVDPEVSPSKFPSLLSMAGFMVLDFQWGLNVPRLFRSLNLLSLPLQSAAQAPHKNANVGQRADHDAQAFE